MRIGLLSNPELVNSNYRAYEPIAAVARRGRHEVVSNSSSTMLSIDDLLSCDVVHIHRAAGPEIREAARRLRARGVGIVWDDDDDIAALPRSNPRHRALGAAGRRERVVGVADMVRLADVVTTPSTVLAAKFRDLGAGDVRVLENRLPRQFMGVRPVGHEGIVIACMAALEHSVDYDQLGLRDVLARLLDAHPDVRLLTIGLRLGVAPERTEHLPVAPFFDLVDTLARADVGIAPLVDIPWNHSRSNVKLKEYAAAGLAWLASPVGPYHDMSERQGGRLVADDEWHDALERLVVDARARRKLAKRGAKWVKQEGVEQHAGAWEDALRDARARAGARTPQRDRSVAR